MNTDKPKKLTLAELAEKHGVPRFTKPMREAMLIIPTGSDYRQKDDCISWVILRKLHRQGYIEASKKMHALCGSILWTMTSKGASLQPKIQAMMEEIKNQKNERPLQSA